MLNESTYSKLFNDLSLSLKEEVILVYKIYFQLTRPQECSTIIDKNNYSEIWRYTHDVFIVKNNGKIGNLIQNDLNKYEFNVENAFKVFKLAENNIKKLSPNYYTKLCGTTGLFMFVLKDILEYCGIILDKKCYAKRAMEISKYGVDYYNKLIDKICK